MLIFLTVKSIFLHTTIMTNDLTLALGNTFYVDTNLYAKQFLDCKSFEKCMVSRLFKFLKNASFLSCTNFWKSWLLTDFPFNLCINFDGKQFLKSANFSKKCFFTWRLIKIFDAFELTLTYLNQQKMANVLVNLCTILDVNQF